MAKRQARVQLSQFGGRNEIWTMRAEVCTIVKIEWGCMVATVSVTEFRSHASGMLNRCWMMSGTWTSSN
jgi:hypothetical protein